MAKGVDQFGGAVKDRVFEKQVGKEIKATSFEIGGGVDWRRQGH